MTRGTTLFPLFPLGIALRVARAVALPVIREVFPRVDEDEDDEADDGDDANDRNEDSHHDSNNSGSGHGLSAGTIAGIAAGIAVVLIIVVILLHYRRRRARKAETTRKAAEMTALAGVKAPLSPRSPSEDSTADGHHPRRQSPELHPVAVREQSEATSSFAPLKKDHQNMVAYQKQLESETQKQTGEIHETSAPPPYQEHPVGR